MQAKLIPALLAALALAGCGANVFKASDAGDPAEDAVIALENDDPSEAILILERALRSESGKPVYLSVLSMAYAYRAGIDVLKFARTVGESGGGGGGGASSNFATLFPLIPRPTDQVLADIDRAVEILVVDLATDDYLPGDTFKLGLYQTASFLLKTKRLDTNGDGVISAEEALDLSDASASGLAGQLAAAQAILAADPDDPKTQAAATALGRYQGAIDAAPGETQEEKLRNYLSSRSGG